MRQVLLTVQIASTCGDKFSSPVALHVKTLQDVAARCTHGDKRSISFTVFLERRVYDAELLHVEPVSPTFGLPSLTRARGFAPRARKGIKRLNVKDKIHYQEMPSLTARARKIAERHLAAIEQTMRLEGQGVSNPKLRATMHKKLVENLMQRPARLWDEA
jgi:hypothetical protein